MNLITMWGYGINNKGFKSLLKDLNVQKCFYLYNRDEDKNFDSDLEHMGIDIYQDPESYFKEIDKCITIDDDLINKMQPYEMTAMDILYRWRRSLTTQETYKEIKELYYKWLRYWNDFIIKNKINLYIITFIPHIPITYFIYAICKVHNIPVITVGEMPLFIGSMQNVFLGKEIGDVDSQFTKRHEENVKLYRDSASTEICLNPTFEEYFLNYNSTQHVDNKRVILLESGNNWKKAFILIKERIQLYIKQRRYRILLNKIIYHITLAKNTKRILKYAESKEIEPALDEEFLFFPLHFQPEATTLPSAGTFANQLLIIKIISRYLPEGVYLYVKEHPAFWTLKERVESVSEARNKNYYDEILNCKNVKLIRHDYSSLELIDKCVGLVTATGTAGWEALFKHKPVLMFGSFFYSKAPGVFKIKTNTDCEDALNTIFNNKVSIDDRALRIFLKTMEPVTAVIANNNDYFRSNGFPVFSEEQNSLIIRDRVINFIEMEYPSLIK